MSESTVSRHWSSGRGAVLVVGASVVALAAAGSVAVPAVEGSGVVLAEVWLHAGRTPSTPTATSAAAAAAGESLEDGGRRKEACPIGGTLAARRSPVWRSTA
ncbi:hypothetical protein [Ornithinimicrobium sufpigmenti]|uniref:hypothetical protein n=1 Tax=Ornithinimicrobium sufpigmenti TaxID=2508882 RepID=UPI0011AF9935|nr:hypothetical protein [Ornithinimicrobium sp. HY008]